MQDVKFAGLRGHCGEVGGEEDAESRFLAGVIANATDGGAVIPLEQRSANYGPGGQILPVACFESSLEHSHAHCVCVMYGCFCAINAELSSGDQDWHAKPKMFILWAFTENVS